jgi:CRISPR-associated protein Cmr6
VSFLSVKPGVSFVFFLHYAGGPVAFDVLQQQFARALAIWGAGGKTAAGYGRFSELVDKPPPPARIRALEELEAFINAAKAGGKSVKAIWRELRGSWGARLRDVPAEPLIRLQRKKLKGKGITEEFKRWLAQLHGEGEGEDE